MAKPSVINRGSLSALLYPGIAEWYEGSYLSDDTPEIYPEIYNGATSERATDFVGSLVPFGMFEVTSEGDMLPYDAIDQGRGAAYINQTFRKGFRVTREMEEDDLYDKINGLAADLGLAARLTIEYVAAAPYMLGFGTVDTTKTYGDAQYDGSTQTYLMSDGRSLYHSNHPLKGTPQRTPRGDLLLQVGDNLVSGALNESNLSVAYIKLRKQPNEIGVIDRLRQPSAMMIPPDLENIFDQLMGSTATTLSTASAPYSAGVKKLFGDGKMKKIVSPYLFDASDWHLMAKMNKQNVGNRWQWRVKPGKVQTEDDFDKDIAKFKQRFRCACGFHDWRGVVGGTTS